VAVSGTLAMAKTTKRTRADSYSDGKTPVER
jgi:hypothetical protein